MNAIQLWQRYDQHLCLCRDIGLSLDISRMGFEDGFFAKLQPSMEAAFEAMDQLERGAVANPDEQRMVGHYWLRDPSRAPDKETAAAIESTVAKIKAFAAEVHDGRICPPGAERFNRVLVIGIGGSALGPQFVGDALGDPDTDRMQLHFLDNTDPDGVSRELRRIGGALRETLSIVISKSGGTPETRNGMLLAREAYEKAGLDFNAHAVAVTGDGSRLDQLAKSGGWLLRLPMWDWVGGRTSETAAVGLLPAALQGLDIDGMLAGAAACDRCTRQRAAAQNPAALLALMWYHATGGRGEKDMVVLPYKDRLLLFSRYLQQLVMESLGKGRDLDGNAVEQGISVYGNKGSTDQHAYVQQLREGVNNFFAVFIRVLEEGGSNLEMEPAVTAGDYLHGLLVGTRAALYENGRESLTITIDRVDAFHVGVLVSLFERAVGFYASLVHINAYHQPGVEAGKKAAAGVLALQTRLLEHLQRSGQAASAQAVAEALGEPESAETACMILEHLAANGRVVAEGPAAGGPTSATYRADQP